ncbi:MAG TPA: cupin domain-containing protein [Beijerinckiaceae bacterium]|jgi:uncharacterized cupin superfamily protein
MNDLTPVTAAAVPPRAKPSSYPAPFAARMEGRVKRPLGDLFGLTSFGVNHTTLAPGAASSLQHVHTRQDEFVFVLSGEATLVSGERTWRLRAGDCAGFKAGGASHHLENRSDEPCVYLEIGDRTPGDSAAYPADDLRAELVDGVWVYSRKDGTPY